MEQNTPEKSPFKRNNQNNNNNSNNGQKSQKICPFFQKGHCKLGNQSKSKFEFENNIKLFNSFSSKKKKKKY